MPERGQSSVRAKFCGMASKSAAGLVDFFLEQTQAQCFVNALFGFEAPLGFLAWR